MKQLIFTIFISFFFVPISHAQLFIDDGTSGAIYIRNASGGALASSESVVTDVSIYVDGDITIEGTFDNLATEVQLSGNFNSTGTFITTGDEVFIGGNAQTISGTLTGSNDFYNLILNKTASTLATLSDNAELNTAGVLAFEGGVLATGSNYIQVNNTATASITGSGANGALDSFVEGELRRNIIAGGGTYDFAVGGTHIDAGGGDGVQYTSLKSNTGNGVVSVIFHDSTGVGISDNVVICPTGIGGFQDVDYRIRNGSWEITNPGSGISNYDIILNPIDYTDNSYVDYTILKDGIGTGRDSCNGVISLPPLTHDSLTSFSFFEVAATTLTTLLPVELLSFTAELTNSNYVELNWQTASEINNDYFSIERSLNDIDWKELIQIKGAGNSASLLSYIAYDTNTIVGISYYRLKQTDFDGQFSYSQIKTVKIVKSEVSQVSIYPIPTDNQITITGNKTEISQINIYNVFGQDVTSHTKEIIHSESKLIIDLSDLNSGMYYIKTKTTANKVYKQ
jgi:hypothetical protein